MKLRDYITEQSDIDKLFNVVEAWVKDAKAQHKFKNFKGAYQTLSNLQKRPLRDLIKVLKEL